MRERGGLALSTHASAPPSLLPLHRIGAIRSAGAWVRSCGSANPMRSSAGSSRVCRSLFDVHSAHTSSVLQIGPCWLRHGSSSHRCPGRELDLAAQVAIGRVFAPPARSDGRSTRRVVGRHRVQCRLQIAIGRRPAATAGTEPAGVPRRGRCSARGSTSGWARGRIRDSKAHTQQPPTSRGPRSPPPPPRRAPSPTPRRRRRRGR